jgi:hypothetical protein
MKLQLLDMCMQSIFVESRFKGLDMKHPIRVLGLGLLECLFVSFIFLHKMVKLALFFSLSQGQTLLFGQNVGSEHLCNYLLNTRYILLCLLLQGVS